MDNNMNENTVKKENHKIISRLLTVTVMVFVALIIAELYLIKKIPDNYLVIIGVGILAVIDVFLLVDEIAKVINNNFNQKKLQIEEAMKSQKAIYLANKRGFESVIEKLDEIEKGNQEAIDNLFTGQKTIGKTMIKKNMESLNDIRIAISTMRLEVPKELINNKVEKEDDTYNLAFDIEKSRQAIVEAINNVSEECAQVKNECATLVNKLDTLKVEDILENLVQVSRNQNISDREVAVDAEPFVIPEDDVPEIAEDTEAFVIPEDIEPEVAVDTEPFVIPEDVEPEIAVDTEPFVIPEDIEPEVVVDTEPFIIAEDIEPEIAEDTEPENAIDFAPVQLAQESDEAMDLLKEMGIDGLDDLLSDENAVFNPEVLAEEAALESMSDSDSELAEVLAAIQDTEPIEQILENESSNIELEAEPSAAPELDLSDPNKQMSADDIAALFAALQ